MAYQPRMPIFAEVSICYIVDKIIIDAHKHIFLNVISAFSGIFYVLHRTS